MLKELHFELVPQQEVQGREVWGARWLKFNCAVQHCLVVLTSQLARVRQRVVQGQEKLTLGLHEGCAIGHNVLVHHFRPLFTVDFQASLREVQRGQCRKHP